TPSTVRGLLPTQMITERAAVREGGSPASSSILGQGQAPEPRTQRSGVSGSAHPAYSARRLAACAARALSYVRQYIERMRRITSRTEAAACGRGVSAGW